jgi:hypothetical protein
MKSLFVLIGTTVLLVPFAQEGYGQAPPTAVRAGSAEGLKRIRELQDGIGDPRDAPGPAKRPAKNPGDQRPGGNEPKPPTSENDYVKVGAEELIKTYLENEVRANKLYKGKWLDVTGTVLRVAGDDKRGTCVFLKGVGNTPTVVSCIFGKEWQGALAVIKADCSYRIRGRYLGMTARVDAVLDNCSFVLTGETREELRQAILDVTLARQRAEAEARAKLDLERAKLEAEVTRRNREEARKSAEERARTARIASSDLQAAKRAVESGKAARKRGDDADAARLFSEAVKCGKRTYTASVQRDEIATARELMAEAQKLCDSAKAETDAERLLKMAKMMRADNGSRYKAALRYAEITEKYKGTKAAKEAEELLRRHGD